jgi:tRNA G46 methylase TrmB
MSILIDPEENESNALFDLPVAWTNSSVLEIGSGDGRLTWRYAGKAARVVAIEPDAEKHELALADRPIGFEHVEFLNLGLDEFHEYVTLSEAKSLKHLSEETLRSLRSLRVTSGEKFDIAILSWSL